MPPGMRSSFSSRLLLHTAVPVREHVPPLRAVTPPTRSVAAEVRSQPTEESKSTESIQGATSTARTRHGNTPHTSPASRHELADARNYQTSPIAKHSSHGRVQPFHVAAASFAPNDAL
eukprot:GHVU01133919.1.p2 GENE.GHVU01133919.1~~GHVU01133919.1.p2  ORF type:complete len:118 (+),score=12.57 GHVU01133919.1:330-683(+)